MTVLYVDDDSDDRELFGAAVHAINPGVEYKEFDEADKIIRFLAAKQHDPDYIFIDINMPKMNGYECAQEIISELGIESSRIVMHSTAFNVTDIDKFRRMGVQMLPKANTFDQLLQNLRKVLLANQPVAAGK